MLHYLRHLVYRLQGDQQEDHHSDIGRHQHSPQTGSSHLGQHPCQWLRSSSHLSGAVWWAVTRNHPVYPRCDDQPQLRVWGQLHSMSHPWPVVQVKPWWCEKRHHIQWVVKYLEHIYLYFFQLVNFNRAQRFTWIRTIDLIWCGIVVGRSTIWAPLITRDHLDLTGCYPELGV